MSETTTVPITADNLPTGALYEDDGAAWRAIRCDPRVVGCEWRWQPLNWTAFGKGEPTGEMHEPCRIRSIPAS